MKELIRSPFQQEQDHYLYIKTIIITLFLFNVYGCDHSVNEIESYGKVKINILTADSVIVSFDNEIVFDGCINCIDNQSLCFNKIIESVNTGVHSIGFKVPKDNFFYEKNIFLEDTLLIRILYYPIKNIDSEKYFDLRTYSFF